jgi:hypothetical protein
MLKSCSPVFITRRQHLLNLKPFSLFGRRKQSWTTRESHYLIDCCLWSSSQTGLGNSSGFGGTNDVPAFSALQSTLRSRLPDDGEMSLNHQCTCRAPPCVELQARTKEGDCGIHQLGGVLLENLKHFGWSPISVADAPSPCPSHGDIVRLFPSGGSKKGDERRIKNDLNDVAYHSAESGSSEGSVEPKESYEVQLAKCCGSISPSISGLGGGGDGSEQVMKTWCRTLSWIAHQVCAVLQVPPNTLLVDDSHNVQESLDLLRVFHYFATPKAEELGSSPHTDWGSLTVVWQDDVGGLQTYCRACHKWVDVKPSSSSSVSRKGSSQEVERLNDSYRWECIVHVGDMASLALDVGNDNEAVASSDAATKPTDTNPANRMCWPSPKHRVVSSATQERTSLVYFGYPPASCSLKSIQEALRDWKPSSRGHRLPLSDYYLLRDQSSTSAAEGGTATGEKSPIRAPASAGMYSTSLSPESHSYSLIRALSVREIVAWKWSQVQRY